MIEETVMVHTNVPTLSWPSRTRPIIIAFEGLDGAGKSTIARRVATLSGARYMTTPSPAVREYRESLLAALGESQEARQLFYLATVFAASVEMSAAVADGQSLVIDRYWLSTQAYAEFRGSRLCIDAVSDLLVPADITIYVDAPLEVRRQRVMTRGASAADIETLTAAADERLRSLHFARRHDGVVGEFLVIDSHAHTIDECVGRVCAALHR
jgi:dTMP kinase